MSKPVRHHLIPAFYLRRFGDDKGQITVYQRATGKTFTTSIKNAAVESHFYTVTDQTGAPSFVVEERLSEIEGDAAAVFAKIDQGRFPPRWKNRASLSLFLALLITRTREFRHQMEEMADFTQKVQLQGLSDDQIRERLSGRGTAPTDEEVEQAAAMLRNTESYRVLPSTTESIRTMLRLSVEQLAPIIRRMKWHLFVSPDPVFLTSDHPIGYFRTPTRDSHLRGTGLRTADEVYFPLDPSMVLVLSHKRTRTPKRTFASPEAIEQINRTIALSSYDTVFHHPAHNPLHGLSIPTDRPLVQMGRVPIYHGGRGIDMVLREFQAFGPIVFEDDEE